MKDKKLMETEILALTDKNETLQYKFKHQWRIKEIRKNSTK